MVAERGDRRVKRAVVWSIRFMIVLVVGAAGLALMLLLTTDEMSRTNSSSML